MSRFTTIRAQRLADAGAEEARRNHAKAIEELQNTPGATAQIIVGVVLPDGTAVRIPHGLGREPRMVTVSPIYLGSSSAGRIVEERSGVARAKAIVLYAFGFGSTVTVDVEVK